MPIRLFRLHDELFKGEKGDMGFVSYGLNNNKDMLM